MHYVQRLSVLVFLLFFYYSCSLHISPIKDVQGPQLPTGAWPGAPYKGCETTMAAI